MAGTRALFASIGASVTLVAAAALALLAVSAVFAFGGWGEFASPPVDPPALVFAAATTTEPAQARTGAASIVAPAPVRTAPVERTPSGASRRARPRNPAPAVDTSSAINPRVNPQPPLEEKTPPPPPPQPASKPTAGDRVTKVGESLSGTVQSTGAALAEVTQPLAAPVSAAVQQVLNLVAEAVRQTAAGLGGAVDSLLAPK